jgi:hypothetical protein
MNYEFTKNSEERQMFVDYWNLCQKHWVPEDSDKYWDEVNKDVYAFLDKHAGIGMSSHLGVALVDALQEKEEKMFGKKRGDKK